MVAAEEVYAQSGEGFQLLPDERPEQRDQDVYLTELPANDSLEMRGPNPDQDLIDLVAAFGFWERVVLFQRPDRTYKVLNGRRRIKTARLLNMETIPATVFYGGHYSPDVITVGAHATRQENIAAEVAAIEALLGTQKADGTYYNERDVSEATGLPLQTLRKRAELMGLHPHLRAALDSNKIKRGVAEIIAKRTKEEQATLASILESSGRVTMNDVDDLRRTTATQTMAGFDFGALTAIPNAEEAAGDDEQDTPLPTPLLAEELYTIISNALFAAGLRGQELDPETALPVVVAKRIGNVRVLSVERPGENTKPYQIIIRS